VGIFGRRRSPQLGKPAWMPRVDMESARPAVFALADTPALADGQVRAAIAEFTRLAETVPLERAVALMQVEPDVTSRPWKWLVEVLRVAVERGDHHLAAAGLFWACYWTSSLVPRFNNVGFFMEVGVDPIPSALKSALLDNGLRSLNMLPDHFIIAGDATGQITAGWLKMQASDLLRS
jgi:hypothetical protein